MPVPPRLLTRVGAVVTCLALTGLAGCSEESESEPTTTGSSASPSAEVQPIEITVEGDTVSPMGERVEIARGEPVTVVVDADRAGELHVHSTPEQEIAFEEGTTEHELVLEQPGVVEVESHDPDVVVLQLEVR